MVSFSKFEVLNEFLNMSVPYHATEDTKPPISYYYTFKIDDTNYVAIITKSNKKYIYNVHAGMMPGKYMKNWKVYPSQMKIFLSTLFDIVVEVETKYLKNIAKGYAFDYLTTSKRIMLI